MTGCRVWRSMPARLWPSRELFRHLSIVAPRRLSGFARFRRCGWLLAQIDSAFAGRAYAAYGGAYLIASIAWM